MENRKCRILILNGDEEIQEILLETMAERRKCDSTVKFASINQRFEDLLREYQPDIILYNINSAEELLPESLKCIIDGFVSPVIFMSRLEDYEIAHYSYNWGAVDFLTLNEASIMELPEIIKRALNKWDYIVGQRRAMEKLDHLNRVLQTSKNVNKLLYYEKEKTAILEGICDILHQDRDLYSAWIVLFNENRIPHLYAERGIGKKFTAIIDDWHKGKLLPCVAQAMNTEESLNKGKRGDECFDCPIGKGRAEPMSLLVKLQFGDHIYGMMSVCGSRELTEFEETAELISDLSADIAFGLKNIELGEALHDYIAKLQENEELTRALALSARDGIIMIDNQGDIVFWNKAAEGIFGYCAEEVLGKELHKILAPSKFYRKYQQGIAQFRETGTGAALNRTLELVGLKKTGEEFPLELSLSAVKIKEQWHAVGVVRDIIERKTVEQELKIRATFTDLNPAPVIRFNEEGEVLLANDAAKTIFNLEKNRNIILADLIQELRDFNFASLISEDAIETKVIRVEDKYFNITVKGVPDLKAGNLYFSDITDLKKAERDLHNAQEQLLQIQKMESLSQFAGGISHDFNNLFTVIMGNVRMALDSLEPDDPLQHELQQIRNAANSAAKLTRQLLTFSSRGSIEPIILNLNSIILDMHELLNSVIGEEIELENKLGESLWNVRVDEGQIDQILTNLLANAKDAIQGSGKVLIKTEKVTIKADSKKKESGFIEGEYVLLSVEDNGCGMSKETVDRAFDPFFTTKGKGKGTGMGLSTVYGIIKQNNGEIDIDSELGGGTEIQILFPAVYEKVEIRKEEKTLSAEELRGSEKILVVEDEDEVRDTTVRMLEKLGYEVSEARSGGEAFLLCEKLNTPPDLILSDIIMPNMSGPEFVQLLRENLWNSIKVLFMSGYPADEIINQGLISERAHYIQKPFEPHFLAQKIKSLIISEQLS